MASASKHDYNKSTWEKAMHICKQSLNYDDFHHIQQLQSYDAILESLEKIQEQNTRRDLPSILSGVPQSLTRFNDFLYVFTLVGQSDNDMVQSTMIWGAVHLTLHVSISYTSVYNSILNQTVSLLGDMSNDLEIFKMYEWLIQQDESLNNLLVDVLADVLIFWVRMIRFLRRNPLVNLANMYWSNIQQEFDETTDRIRKHLKQVKETAEALSLKQASSQSQHIVRKLDGLSLDESRVSRLPFSNIPFPQYPQFFGRSNELNRIREELDPGATQHKYNCLTLTGMGGAGKTQIALRYGYERIQKGAEIIMWIQSDGDLALLQSFTEIAKLLELPGASDADKQNRSLVRRWLQNSRKLNSASATKKHWLMIFDNVEDGYAVTESIPSAPLGSVLITTRNEKVGFQLASKAMRVPPFTVEEGTTLLLNIVQCEKYSKEEREAASALSKQLDGLPLAINLMASQIISRQMSPIQFFKYFERYSERLLEKGRSNNVYYKQGINTAFHASFDSLDEISITVFGVACFVSPDAIPDELFKPDPETPVGGEEPWDDPWVVDEAMQNLLSASLMVRDPITNNYRIHRLVQKEFRDWLGTSRRETAFINASRLLFECFPKQVHMQTLHPYWPACKKYIQHVASLSYNVRKLKLQGLPWPSLSTFVQLSSNAAWYLFEASSMQEGDEILEVAFLCCEKRDTLIYATLCQTAGVIQREQGKTSLAYPWFKKAMDIRKRLLPANHPDLANIYTNTAGALLTDYRTDEAIRMYTSALDINLKLPRDQQIKIVFLQYINLSVANGYKQAYDEAYEMLQLAHEAIIEAFGQGTHYEAMENLSRATLQINERKFLNARQSAERAFKHFFAEAEYHPTTLAARHKLSLIDLAEHKIEDAIARLRKTLEICEVAEPTPGAQGQTARTSWKLSEILLELDPESEEGKSLRFRAEGIRKEMQGDRYRDLPAEDLSYDMLLAHYFR